MTVALYPVSAKLSEDGAYYHRRCVEKNVPMVTEADYDGYDVYVDCLLGTGFQGVPREPVASVIRALNSARAQDKDKYVISVDINSGMNGDTGEGELTVVSDLTVSIGSVKQGLFKPQARARIGKLVNADIGIPVDWVNIDTLL